MRPAQDSRCPQAEQTVGWALHALEPAEEAEAAAHLPTCEECRALVDETEELLAMLGSSEQTFEPPAELRAGLLARVAATPQQPTLPLPSLRPAPSQAPPRLRLRDLLCRRNRVPRWNRSAHLSLPSRPRTSLPSRRPRRPGPRSYGPDAGSSRWSPRLSRSRWASVDWPSAPRRWSSSATPRPLRPSSSRASSQLQRPGAKTAMLTPPNGAPVAAVVVADGERKLITVGMMPNPTSTHTYVLWGISTAPPQALDAFDVTQGTTGPRRVGSADEADSFTGYAISLEPGRSAPASPSQVVASGQVQI